MQDHEEKFLFLAITFHFEVQWLADTQRGPTAGGVSPHFGVWGCVEASRLGPGHVSRGCSYKALETPNWYRNRADQFLKRCLFMSM